MFAEFLIVYCAKMEMDVFNEMKDFVVHGVPDSTAEIYADNFGLKFEKISN